MKQTFTQFNVGEDIIRALQKLKYETPLEVQAKVIPIIQQGHDVIVQSQTGSGKTAAFAIPLCDQIDWNISDPQVLILTPTRELAIQIKDEMQNIGLYKRIKVAAVFGRQPYKTQLLELKQKVHAVSGTPGRVLDHLQRGSLKVDQIRTLVIDEADEMLNMGFIEQVVQIIKQLPRQRMTLLFSATMSQRIVELSQSYMNKPKHITIQTEELIVPTIEHSLYEVEQHLKLPFLIKLLAFERPESVIIFGKTQENVNDICDALVKRQFSVDKIHGGMLQEDRIQNMGDFRRGKYRILVATDVVSRGIDIDDLTHVINFDLPVEAEAYVHRIGRTGRVGKQGKAISLVSRYDNKMLMLIEELIQQKITALDPAMINEYEPIHEDFDLLQQDPTYKEAKNKQLKQDVFKIHLNGGKNKKIRAGDIVGAVSQIPGITAEDIGIIDVQEIGSYVDILNGKGKQVLTSLQKMTIKGKTLRVEKAKTNK